MKNSYLLFIAVILFACNRVPKRHALKSVNSAKKVKANSLANTSSVYTPEFPADTIYPARILTESVFHSDEVEKKDGKREWIGLFKTDSNFYLAPFKIHIQKVKDDIIDEGNARTGWEVKTGVKDSAILLIAGLSNLKLGTLNGLINGEQEIKIGAPINFDLNNVVYQLYAIGKKKILTGPEDYIYENYKLFIRTNINGQTYNQVLASSDQVTNSMTIRFAGDLDGDGVPDLIIDTTDHENVERPTLYLSKPAEKGKLLKVMGLHTVVGC